MNAGTRLRKAGLTTVPVIVVEGAVSPKDVLESQIAENCIRSDISPIDQANAFRKYMTLANCSATELSELLHISQSTVSRSLALLNLDPVVQEQVASGDLSPKAALPIGRIKNPKVQKQVAAEAVATKAPAEEVKKRVQQRRGIAAKATPGRPLTFKLGRGTKVVVHGKLDGSGVVAALKAATALAEQQLVADTKASALDAVSIEPGDSTGEQAEPGE